jgi:ribonuclease-3
MSDLSELESALGHRFSDGSLLRLALVHRSTRAQGEAQDNEVLEFLGDAVLDLAISDLATDAHPDLDEGRLTRMRAALVNARKLADLGRSMGVGAWLRLGKGEVQSGGSDKDRILATAVEALFGAVFRDAGYEETRSVVERHFGAAIREGKGFDSDAKTDLQELTQEHFKVTPEYHTLEVSGPDHEKHYLVEVRLQQRTLAEGSAASRKQAEQIAARDAGRKLRSELEDGKES